MALRPSIATIGLALFLWAHPVLATVPEKGLLHPSVRSIRREALERRSQEVQEANYLTVAATQNYYLNDRFGVSIRYPSDWNVVDILQKNGVITTVSLFVSPLAGSGDTAQENVNFIVEDLSLHPLSLPDYTKAAINREQTLFDDVDLLYSQEILLQNLPAHLLAYQATFREKRLAFAQIWYPRGTSMHIWTLATPPETFSSYSQLFRQMMETISFQ